MDETELEGLPRVIRETAQAAQFCVLITRGQCGRPNPRLISFKCPDGDNVGG
jgi:hypothetical protein